MKTLTSTPKESAAAYIESYKRATTDEVLNYSLFEAGKQLQKAGDWEGIEALYTEFVKTHPDHQAVVTALYWVGKAKAKLGRMEEAKGVLSFVRRVSIAFFAVSIRLGADFKSLLIRWLCRDRDARLEYVLRPPRLGVGRVASGLLNLKREDVLEEFMRGHPLGRVLLEEPGVRVGGARFLHLADDVT